MIEAANIAPPEVRGFLPQVGIYLPEEFDRKIECGAFDATSLEACTVMTLPRLLKDLKAEDVSCRQWVQTFPDECRPEQKKFGPFKRTVIRRLKNTLPMIQENREYYGWQVGIKDVITEQYPVAARIIFSGNYAPILYLNRAYTASNHPISGIEDIYELAKKANSFRNSVPTNEQAVSYANLLIKPLGSFEAARNVIEEASKRRGVQVFYGRNGFPRSFDGKLLGPGDSGHIGTDSYDRRIPKMFISTLVPVGEYEQSALGV